MIDALLHLILERSIAVEKKKILKFSSTRHRKKVRLIIEVKNFKLSSVGSIICTKIQQWFKKRVSLSGSTRYIEKREIRAIY